MSESNIAHCKACVAATDGQDYMTNFMVALEAGCQQQPAAGVLLGLNDTIFAATTISAVDPSASAAAANTRTELPTTTIVGIAVGAIVVLLAVAGFFFVRCRARRNRSVRLVASPNPSAGKRSKHRPVSSLSFRCQTHLSPRSPKFFSSPIESTIHEEKPFAAPRSTFISSNTSPELAFSEFSSWTKPASKSERGARGNGPSLPLHNISTSIPTVPAGVYHSTSPKSRTFSPTDDMTTPASTTSTKSTSHLLPLRHYNPAEYGVAAPQMGTFLEATYVSPTSGTTASPLLSRAWDQKPPIWDKPLPPRGSSRPAINMINVLGKNKEKRSSGNTGSPVETKEIGVKFPGPPSPKRF